MTVSRTWIVALMGVLAGLAWGCDDDEAKGSAAEGAQESSEPSVIAIDGSSTVFPITEAVAEEFQKKHDARVTIGVSGTGGGFKKFCSGEIEVSGASRPITQVEIDRCKKNGAGYIELPVAYDGITIAVHPDNDWVDHMTVEELKKLWRPEAQGEIKKWSQVRTGWPDKEIHLFGAGVDSGTYDYFTKAVVGEEHASRGDFTSSEDDNVLVQGISTDPLALGFFGFAYFDENRDKLKALAIDDGNADNGKGPIEPSTETIANMTYQPLSRPIFIYVREDAAKLKTVQEFVKFYLDEGQALVKEVGYVPMPQKAYTLVEKRFEKRKTGSLFAEGGAKIGVSVEELLADE